MGVRYPSVFSNTLLTTSLPGTGYSIICVTPPLVMPYDTVTVFLEWSLNLITATAGITQMEIAIARGNSLLSVDIGAGQWYPTVTTNKGYWWGGCYFDQPGLGQVHYSLTGYPLNATTNTSVNDACITAFIL